MNSSKPALRDHLKPGLRILFIGINPGLRSAKVGHHFAGHSNRFWKLLYDSGLVQAPLSYREDWRLPEWGLGITNIINRDSAGIDALTSAEYKAGLKPLESKVRRYQPKVVALLGVTIYRMLFSETAASSGALQLGLTVSRLSGVPIFLLPNPSGRNAHYSYHAMLIAFQALRAEAVSQ